MGDFLAGVCKVLRPVLRNHADALALELHLLLVQEDYRPVVPRADSKATPQSLEDVTDVDGLPVGWNSEDGQYTFYYVYTPEGQGTILICIALISMGDIMVVNAALLVPQGDVVHSLDIPLAQHVNTGARLNEWSSLFLDTTALLAKFRSHVLHQLARPAGAASTSASGGGTKADADPRRAAPPRTLPTPAAPAVADPRADDPLRIDPLRIAHRPGRPQLPFADPMQPFGPFGGGGILGPTGPLVGPNHPGWGPMHPHGPGGTAGPFGGPGAPWGQRPPPGARFDPFGPQGFGGEPDNDLFMPPGPPGFGRRGDDMFG